MKEKQRSDEAAKKLQEEIQFIKSQKVDVFHYQLSSLTFINEIFIALTVLHPFNRIYCFPSLQVQLQHKIKQEAEQFRQWKASREKELLQVCRIISLVTSYNSRINEMVQKFELF